MAYSGSLINNWFCVKRNTTLPGQTKSTSKSQKVKTPDAGKAQGTDLNSHEKLARVAVAALEDAKAEDIVRLPLDGKTAVADEMIVASGRSNIHVSAVTDKLVETLKSSGFGDLRVEGQQHCDWVLIDAGDVIIHIFRPEVRVFYNLEKLWSPEAPDEDA
ncbi:MAG TPA: ribosome silencing factor [Rhizobiales bacterium]|nr:ribosome silencing factor [Hyphomicrobiales bacterium]